MKTDTVENISLKSGNLAPVPVQDVGQGQQGDVLHAVRGVVERRAEAVDSLVRVAHHAPVQRGRRAQHPRRCILISYERFWCYSIQLLLFILKFCYIL